jgi:hypothetical protein
MKFEEPKLGEDQNLRKEGEEVRGKLNEALARVEEFSKRIKEPGTVLYQISVGDSAGWSAQMLTRVSEAVEKLEKAIDSLDQVSVGPRKEY